MRRLCGVGFCRSSITFAVLFVGISRCCVKAKVVVERVVIFYHHRTTSAHLRRLRNVCFLLCAPCQRRGTCIDLHPESLYFLLFGTISVSKPVKWLS